MKIARILLAVTTVVCSLLAIPAHSGSLKGDYTDPTYQTSIPFGFHSHWYQPWRGYLETMPANQFVNGIGMNFNLSHGENEELIAQHLAKNGVKHGRIEIGWGSINYDDESQIVNAASVTTRLLAMKHWGIRPLILLNGNQGVPCPAKLFERTATAAAPAGATTLQISSTAGLVIGKSGLSNLRNNPANSDRDYCGAQALITAISGNTITISQPLRVAVASGETLPMATLKYRPFSVPGSADYNATAAGWKNYVQVVGTFAANALGTTGASDKGFDIECWNELSGDSNFLYINRYYSPPAYTYDEWTIENNLMTITADQINANSTAFSGVQLSDGLANTIPWTASSQLPNRVTALNKHPYSGIRNYPADGQRMGSDVWSINALGQQEVSPTAYVPTYTGLLPEYFATASQTEHMARDMSPLTTDIYGTNHGRYTRGTNNPCWNWITEVNMAFSEMGITDGPTALALRAKLTSRYLTFFLNKGTQRVYFYGAAPNNFAAGDTEFGMVKKNFIDYSITNTTYPADDSSYTSPAMLVMRRMTDKMKEGLDTNLTLASTRQITVKDVSDTHDHVQFYGDGSMAHPNLYNRNVLAILPFQVNSSKFVIPYYVQTRDFRGNLGAENYSVDLSGIKGVLAAVSAYDPITDLAVPVTVQSRGPNTLSLLLSTIDTPRFLIIQEDGIASGSILRERWTGIGGVQVSDLTSNAAYPNNPTGRDYPTSFEAPTDWGSSYGQRFRGYVKAPTTGNYTFWVASDDCSELYLSTDTNAANKQKIAWLNGAVAPHQWNAYPSQNSASNGFTLSLQANQKYYIEALQKEDSGGDNLSVAWQGPAGSPVAAQTLIAGAYLTPFQLETGADPEYGTGLKAQYYSGMTLSSLVKTQTDQQIDFNWGLGSPINSNGTTMTSIGPDTFSVRWTGQIKAVESGTYTFTTTTDDGVRLWVNNTSGTPIVDSWVDQGATAHSGTITLQAGQKYNIKMEYYENGGDANCRLEWTRPGATKTIVPRRQLFPAP